MALETQRPKTLVVHHRSGIGDLIWHLPYIRAVAAGSAGGTVSVMARSSSLADDILIGEPCVDRVFVYDRRPRGNRKGKHDSLAGQMAICRQLRREHFDRIVIFSGRPRYGVLACLAGIPQRLGFGFSFAQRLFLNRPPYIEPYRGEGSWVYPEASAFAVAHGFVQAPVVPKMRVPDQLLTEVEVALAELPHPRIALAIGASTADKNWGMNNFARLAEALAERGYGVLVLGGPGEQKAAEAAFATLPQSDAIRLMCQPSVLRSAAALKKCRFCIGNDTGILNVAVAVDTPALGLFGPTRPLSHDPLMHAVSAKSMDAISLDMVLQQFAMLDDA